MDPHSSLNHKLIPLILLIGFDGACGFAAPARARIHLRLTRGFAAKPSWSITDNWNALSEAENRAMNPLLNNLIQQVDSEEMTATAEEQHLSETIDAIQNGDAIITEISDPSSTFEDQMGAEIAMLVRCNEHPHSLLVHEGKALPPLAEAEKFDPSQLAERFLGQWVLSKFLDNSVGAIFETYAKPFGPDGLKTMDARSVAQWLQQCLQPDQPIGPHDQRVLSTLATFSAYGTGYLVMDNMKQLYKQAVVGGREECSSYQDIMRCRSDAVLAVWRDLRNHGILPPCEIERNKLKLENLKSQLDPNHQNLLDECELVFEGLEKRKRSSHELVDLAYDNETPLWINDGDFVFIDEDSCIGCTNCAQAAPGSFEILSYDGRARAFAQRPKSPDIVAAIATCPVDCMHYVSYDELKELERARDLGDGRQDHRHFGTSDAGVYVERKPLHVQRRESDASHRSSWYHYLKDKCCKSLACPQRGCFDCPSYKNGSNPYFTKRVNKATHIRAKQFIDMGIADRHRKFSEL